MQHEMSTLGFFTAPLESRLRTSKECLRHYHTSQLDCVPRGWVQLDTSMLMLFGE